MDIGFSEEQELLRDTARKFLDDNCTTRFVRDMMATEAAVTPEFWRHLAENGWLGIAFSEADGGSGLGLTDLVVLMEEIGRAVMPGPYPATVLLGGAAIAEAGSAAQRAAWLPRIAAGEAKATLAWTEPNARWDAFGITADAREAGGGFTLSGVKMFVPDAHLADVVVVAARTRDGSTMEDGISLFLVPKDTAGLGVKLLPSVDETRKLCEVRLDNVRVPADALLGELHRGLGAAVARCRSRRRSAVGRDVRRGAAGARHYGRIREAAGRVRQADRQLPGRQAQMRRHAGRYREREVADLLRGLGGGRGRPRIR